ncbi:hypothetical protein E0485_05240 [Paenibacillus albiflavus]|uniref:Methyltransferase domain-containing protein n=1 Tax=Paenibacillus albiflavus TaxID=2545760 RepID=A0A4R4EGQ8_9BACL|nr:class I SAM-dependent methyltransferase [Paenibacillus albiflavus]TCZ79274.1 hypothetical protein E0485_05240 [Paenibacillus albiflavus]
MPHIDNSDKYKPTIVETMRAVASSHQFEFSCTDSIGRLLRTLVGQITSGSILEIGTGYGVGAAWIISALSQDVSFYTVDILKKRIAVAKSYLEQSNVTFITGDWKEAALYGPYKFIFADVSSAKQGEADQLVELVEPGGIVLIDDLTPEEYWPVEWQGKPDALREYWLNHSHFEAQELRLSPREACIIATRNK